jgi:prepilin-type N-terminal cleavage/methylation domain-containing protein
MNQTPGSIPRNTAPLRGFTLIELLIVIGIIAILAALAIPAGLQALNSAKKTTAKNQCVQIATAITAYETEYGRLPNFSGSNLSSSNLGMLLAGDSTNNPRAIAFIETGPWRSGKGGTNTNGAFCDPFSSTNVYRVALDTNYVNQITAPTNASGAATNITKHVGVWTIPRIGNTNVLINSWD